jgi:hypothetical protein
MFAKIDSQIHLLLLGKSKGDLAKKVGVRAPCENENFKGISNQRREARVEVHV